MGKHSAPRKNHVPAQLAILSTATLIGLGISAQSGAGAATADSTITATHRTDDVAPAPAKRVGGAVAQTVSHHGGQESRNAVPPKKRKPKPAADKPKTSADKPKAAPDPLELLNSGSAALSGLAKSLNTGSSAIAPLGKALGTGSTAVSGSASSGSAGLGGLAPLLGLLSGSA
ncbi:hypothetical protein [Nocardia brasiliensis]|uniref:hypothetical protein n=1 Tax=Nocardia brasiliensis TaxID=37326 RepID=UPI0018954C13|nr:hypothetical protein [Nocardia brasiliensis]MBF6130283.1 hypothetical protein [Nocardia brasiliensis]MBF6543533.1 hypothetical protein [Nocardia brasiliensis]